MSLCISRIFSHSHSRYYSINNGDQSLVKPTIANVQQQAFPKTAKLQPTARTTLSSTELVSCLVANWAFLRSLDLQILPFLFNILNFLLRNQLLIYFFRHYSLMVKGFIFFILTMTNQIQPRLSSSPLWAISRVIYIFLFAQFIKRCWSRSTSSQFQYQF